MRDDAFRAWLAGQGQVSSSISTRLSDARRVEAHYGDLDEAFARDRLDRTLAALAYSAADRAAGKSNSSLLSIDGDLYNSLASYRAAVTAYRRFAEQADEPAETQAERIRRFALDTVITPARVRGDREVEVVTGDIHRAMSLDNAMPAVCSALGGSRFQDLARARIVDRQGPANGSTVRLRYALDALAVGASSGLSQTALERYRRLFLARYPDFVDFGQRSGGYFEEERAYKDALIGAAAEAFGEEGGDEALGTRLLNLLTGRAGLTSGLLGWRTDGRLSDLRGKHPSVLETAVGRLARAEDVDRAIAAFVAAVWPVLVEGQTSKPYSESRNIPSMLAALVHPHRAYGINTEPVQRTAEALLGRKPLGYNPMTAAEYANVLAMAEALRKVMGDDWGWAPRDLWDVQGFIWAVNRADQPKLPEEDGTSEGDRLEEVPMPTNLILHGPPGTGKTFRTAREAVRLCDGSAPAGEAEVRRRYAELVSAGQVRFVTFHQSYSYEDFVEGLRPTTGEEGQASASGGFRLEPVPGVFREIASVAEQAMRSAGAGAPFDMTGRRVFKMSLGRAGSEDHIFDAAIEGGYVVLGWGGDIDWSPYDTYEAIHAKWNELNPGTNGNDANIIQTVRFRANMREGDLVVVSYGNSRFRAIGEVIGDYEFAPTGERDYHHRRAVRWLFVPDGPLPISFYAKPFTMRSCYLLRDDQLNRDALALLLPGSGSGIAATPKQFVLICDEINRANISKVFGELITLIEPDKRIGAGYELRLVLPYSKQSFGVPSNLHIVGTMNTADRSIALLDTALRRRFTFEEVMPDPDLLATAGDVDLGRLLRQLNDRIEYLFDREHQIGHAYLIGCGDRSALDDAMRHRIIPLLAEYFHEDWGKIAAVLGDPSGERLLQREVLVAPAGIESEYGGERYRWRVRPQFGSDAYAGLQ